MEEILSCFERYFSKRQFSSLLFVLHLLLASEKKVLSRAEGKSESAFSRFFGLYKWDRKAVEEARRQAYWSQVEEHVKEHRKYLDKIIFLYSPRNTRNTRKRCGERRAFQYLASGFSLRPLRLCGRIVV